MAYWSTLDYSKQKRSRTDPLTLPYMKKDFQQLNTEFDILRKLRKNIIRNEPNKWKRFWKWVWYYLSGPFQWLWVNLHDWRTAVILLVVMVVVSSEVWVMYLLYFITQNKWFLGIATTLWGIWWLPGVEFIPLCILITIGIKAIINKLGKTPRGENI